METRKIPKFCYELLRKQFVIDEQAEEVIDLFGEKEDNLFQKMVRQSDNMQEGDQEGDGEERVDKARPDLISQVVDLMLRQDHLEQLATELQSSRDSDSKSTLRQLFRSALPVLDSFDRIMQMVQKQPPTPEVQNWIKSVSSVQSRLQQTLERFGLRCMDPLGKKVNLDRHEVVEVIHTDSIPDETVVEVRQKGYMFDNKIIRDARVVVAQEERR